MQFKFKNKDKQQVFLGQLSQKNIDLVFLKERPHDLYIVTLANEDIYLKKAQFNKEFKHIKRVADMFKLKVVVATIKPNYWVLSDEGKKLKNKETQLLFEKDEWNNLFKECMESL